MNAEELSKRGENYLSEKNYDCAITEFNELLKIEPDNPYTFYKLGLAYTNKNEFNLAIENFSKAIKIEPEKVGAFYFNRGLAYNFIGEKIKAISDIETAIKIDPQDNDFREALNVVKSTNNKSGGLTFGKVIRIIAIIFIIISIIGGIAAKNPSVPIMTIFFVVVIWMIVEWVKKKTRQVKKFIGI
ncbi:MAG: tetratricopeptide repeat protein [Treponema sp.]|jgi:tetratricopeptide (TPR) repeat protein|nr:tetratricopeptide repeat protein [Treponema sp.]